MQYLRYLLTAGCVERGIRMTAEFPGKIRFGMADEEDWIHVFHTPQR